MMKLSNNVDPINDTDFINTLPTELFYVLFSYVHDFIPSLRVCVRFYHLIIKQYISFIKSRLHSRTDEGCPVCQNWDEYNYNDIKIAIDNCILITNKYSVDFVINHTLEQQCKHIHTGCLRSSFMQINTYIIDLYNDYLFTRDGINTYYSIIVLRIPGGRIIWRNYLHRTYNGCNGYIMKIAGVINNTSWNRDEFVLFCCNLMAQMFPQHEKFFYTTAIQKYPDIETTFKCGNGYTWNWYEIVDDKKRYLGDDEYTHDYIKLFPVISFK